MPASAAEQDQAFLDAFRRAYAARDRDGLLALLSTKGAHPMAKEFYLLMLAEGAGGQNARIELQDLTPQEIARAAAVQEGPDGVKIRLPLKPIKRLVITVSTADGSGSSTSSNQVFVAESEGRLVIPVPVPVK